MSEIPPEFLAADYQAALNRMQRIEDRLLFSGVGGALLCVGSAAYTLGHRTGLNLGYAWAAPLPFLAVAALLLALLAWRFSARTQAAALRPANSPGLPASPYAPLLHRLVLLPAAGLALLYGLTLLFSLRAIYDTSRAAGTSFVVVYTLLSAALGLAGWAVWRLRRGAAPLTAAEVRRRLLPYPAELLAGFVLFGAGFLAPLLTVGLNAGQLPVINALFRRGIDFTTSLPLAAVAALGMAVFFVFEGLLLPAGRAWQDRRRGLPTSFGYAQILLRLLLALPAAYLLGGMPLLLLAILLCLQQAAAGVSPLPSAPAFPPASPPPGQTARQRFDLLWGALAAPLRFYAGVLVWVGSAWSFTIFLLLFCAAAFLSVGLRAAGRARQARIQTVRGEEPALYDRVNCPRWQRAGFLAAAFTALGLTVLQALAETTGFFNAILAAGYGHCNNGLTEYSQAGWVNGLLLVFDLLLLGLLACALLVRLLAGASPAMALFSERARMPGAPLLLAAAAALGVAAFAANMPSLAMGGLLSATLGLMLWHEL